MKLPERWQKVIEQNGKYIIDFESKDESFYKKVIEKLQKRWNKCITLEGYYVDKYSRILRKTCVFLS